MNSGGASGYVSRGKRILQLSLDKTLNNEEQIVHGRKRRLPKAYDSFVVTVPRKCRANASHATVELTNSSSKKIERVHNYDTVQNRPTMGVQMQDAQPSLNKFNGTVAMPDSMMMMDPHGCTATVGDVSVASDQGSVLTSEHVEVEGPGGADTEDNDDNYDTVQNRPTMGVQMQDAQPSLNKFNGTVAMPDSMMMMDPHGCTATVGDVSVASDQGSVLTSEHVEVEGPGGADTEDDDDVEADSWDDPDYSPGSSSVSDDESVSEGQSFDSAVTKVQKHVASIVDSDLFEDSDSIVPSSCIDDELTFTGPILPDLSQHRKSQNGKAYVINRFIESQDAQPSLNKFNGTVSMPDSMMMMDPHGCTATVGDVSVASDQGSVLTSEHVAASAVSESQMVTVVSAAAKDISHMTGMPRKSDRPSRPCPFCGQFKVRLTRHIKAMHKSEGSVKRALMGGVREQRRVFKEHKRAGIMKHNLSVIGLRDGKMQRERAPKQKKQDDGVVCDNCQGLFSRGWFANHSKLCIGDGCVVPHAVPAEVFYSPLDVPDDFKTEILSRFRQDDVGKLCQSDEIITMIGSKLFKKVSRRQDKKLEVRRSVMASMRRLAKLYVQFKEEWQKRADVQKTVEGETNCLTAVPAVIDMFHRRNYCTLEQACVAYTSRKDDSDKSALMLAVYYLLVDAGKKIKVHYLIREDSATAKNAAEFLEVLAHNKDSLIGGAVYNSNKNRQIRLRRTQNLPQQEDLQKLKSYTVDRVNTLVNDQYLQWTSTEFLEVRDLACSRLTLFNARRGGEPARLHLSDWVDACNKVWFNPSAVQELVKEEKPLIGDNTMIMYQTGKGVNHLVPVLVPPDTVEALKKVADAEQRKLAGIHEENPYLFPSMSKSDSHVSGWHAITRVSLKAGVPERRITATKMRHLTSTMYAALDIPEAQRSAFYRHMGHAKEVNEHIYQAPIAEIEVRHVGAVLRKFDEMRNVGEDDSRIACSSQLEDAPATAVDCGVGDEDEDEDEDSTNLSLSAPTSGQLQEQQSVRKQRQFTRWSADETKVVVNYFRSFVTSSGLPRKAEVMAFKEQHMDMKHDWTVIRTKVLNEQKAFMKLKQKRLTKLRM